MSVICQSLFQMIQQDWSKVNLANIFVLGNILVDVAKKMAKK
jgi:hypothetical protein